MEFHGGDMPRLALACWDYSWLTRRDGRATEYAHIGARLDELVERGFNALRIDPFPHLIAPPETGIIPERFEIHPEGRELRRGSRRPVVVQPRKALRQLLVEAKKRDIRLWLSSWFLSDTTARRSFVRRPRDFVTVWSETLEFIREQGFADSVVAVDFCHQFPAPPAAHGAYRNIFHHHPANPLPMLIPWDQAVMRRLDHYLLEIPRALRSLYPQYHYGLSVGGEHEKHLRLLDTTELDFLDLHLWLNDDPLFALASGDLLRFAPGRLADRMQTRVVGLAWRGRPTYWQARLEERLDEALEYCRQRRLTPVMSEGHVRFPVEGDADWGLSRQITGWLVRKGLERGVRALSPGLYARPHTAPIWRDRAWLKSENDLILTGPGR